MLNSTKKFAACIFDMDGVLLDSEPFWRRAERELFHTVGIELSEDDCIQTMGMRIDLITEYRYSQHPWGSSPSCAELALKIQERVAQLVTAHGQRLPGVSQAIQFLQAQNIPLALASASSPMLINAVLEALQLHGVFQAIRSAERETYPKPHPSVFINTAQMLEADPSQCLVIEDSISGVIAAKAARMTCVAIPEKALRHKKQFAIADLQLESLLELPEHWQELEGSLI